jgi:UDP-N-acetylglucosamine--N-acetylmuramyl-(pentapeptide) pyrophosphoryl-undecaprenol N-acetylglucosamine transferase
MRAILAGGGTGGHVIPALAIARELKDRYQAELLFIGTSRGIENKLVPAAGFDLKLIEVGALKNVSLATRLKTLFALPRAISTAKKMLRDFRPDVVIGVGGYASGPAMIAAQRLGIPTLAFEPNLVPGLANRLVARKVNGAAVHFEETAKYFAKAKVTGVPVRPEFFGISPRPSDAAPSLLVFGGSQGAAAINAAVVGALPRVKAALPNIKIVHQTGERELAPTRAGYDQAGVAAEVSGFITDMPRAFANADLIVCRSGASTVAEITAAGKPAIFVPFPRAADDHQTRNAQALEKAGAALLIPQVQLTSELLAKDAVALLLDRSRLAGMSAAAQKLAHPNAGREIAEMAAEIAGGRSQETGGRKQEAGGRN